MIDDGTLLKAVIPIVLASAGAAWGGVKLALNGTRKAIAEGRKEAQDGFNRIHLNMQRIEDKVTDARERVAHLEGKAAM